MNTQVEVSTTNGPRIGVLPSLKVLRFSLIFLILSFMVYVIFFSSSISWEHLPTPLNNAMIGAVPTLTTLITKTTTATTTELTNATTTATTTELTNPTTTEFTNETTSTIKFNESRTSISRSSSLALENHKGSSHLSAVLRAPLSSLEQVQRQLGSLQFGPPEEEHQTGYNPTSSTRTMKKRSTLRRQDSTDWRADMKRSRPENYGPSSTLSSTRTSTMSKSPVHSQNSNHIHRKPHRRPPPKLVESSENVDYGHTSIHYVRDDSSSTVFGGFEARLSSPLPRDFLPDDLRDQALCDPATNKIKAIDRERMICYQSALPPYAHPVPHFVHDHDREVWHMQPKNVMSMQPGWMNNSYETCFVLRPGATAIHGSIQSGDMWSFQHWHDNALGLIYQMRQGFDMLEKAFYPCKLTPFLTRQNPITGSVIEQEWAMTGFPVSIPQTPVYDKTANRVFLRRFIRDKDQERVHPEAAQWLISKYPPTPPMNLKKVVWISRQGSSGVGTRQFRNESTEIEYLRAQISGFDYFHPKGERLSTVDQLRNRLGDACMIIGVHGGQMYNQFYASKNTSVLELVPIDSRGWITTQKTLQMGPFAQRAIWHNANVIGQPYWRVHFSAEKMVDFEISKEVLDRIIETVRRAGCQIDGDSSSAG